MYMQYIIRNIGINIDGFKFGGYSRDRQTVKLKSSSNFPAICYIVLTNPLTGKCEGLKLVEQHSILARLAISAGA